MRHLAILAAGIGLAFVPTAQAQEGQAPTQPPVVQDAEPAAPQIQSVSIVDIEQLPDETRTQVDAAVAQRGESELAALRQSIDSTPMISTALQEQGMTSKDVVIASLSQDGRLTLVTRKGG
jgi:hypothetical protein